MYSEKKKHCKKLKIETNVKKGHTCNMYLKH